MSESKPAGVFVQLLTAELQALKRTATTMRFRDGQVIFNQGDPGDGIYVVEEGGVEIAALLPGHERHFLSRIPTGGFFGEMAVLDEEPRSASASAIDDTVLSFIPAAEMWSALERSPKLLMSLMRECNQRMRQIDRRFLDEILQAERLALVGRFAQSIVHDFKNPLNMIGFAADVAAGDDASAEARSFAKQTIRKQVDRLANMINELLDYTRGSSGSVARKPVDFHAFIHDAVREIRPEVEARNVGLESENQPPQLQVAIDQKRLLHVLFNLINNALDVLPAGGRITLRFYFDDREVTTEIEDTGPGIPPEIVERIFDPFVTHGKKHGTGLGLAICKRIVGDHQGHIHARSEPGRGAVFSFSLPRCGAP
jgi:signal transduction histidine kinase